MDSDNKKVITTRKLKIEDAKAINEIHSLITHKKTNMDFSKIIREHVQKEGHEAHFVTEYNGKVVGFMISYFLPLGFESEKSAYIATMGVHPKYMGMGVGVKMAKEIFEFYKSKGISHVYTSARWDSSDILSFCKTIGFEKSEFINLSINL